MSLERENRGPGIIILFYIQLSVLSSCVLCFPSSRAHIWFVPVPVLVLVSYFISSRCV